MNETAPALARYAFASGVLRGTDLTLHPTCVVHRGARHIETLPLAGITAVRVSFERNARQLGWGVALVMVALVLLAVSSPLTGFASGAAADLAAAGAQGVTRLLLGFFRLLEALGSLLPVAALACIIGGGALCGFGWLGSTALLVSLPGSERAFSARGRDSALLDFSAALSERLMQIER